jgi:hypothetical protein
MRISGTSWASEAHAGSSPEQRLALEGERTSAEGRLAAIAHVRELARANEQEYTRVVNRIRELRESKLDWRRAPLSTPVT